MTVPNEIITEYNLHDFVTANTTKYYVEVTGAIYGMKQAGYLANKELVEHLSNHGYTQYPSTPCLFRHHTDDIEFTLITDDFLVRYSDKAAADRLLAAMTAKYPMTHDWDCRKYAGFNIDFDYTPATRKVEISMKGYIAAMLKRFHANLTHNVYSPEFFQPINYASKSSQYTKSADVLV